MPPSFDRAAYWEHRYAAGGRSGAGSAGAEAAYKARLVNTACAHYGIRSLLDLGCGDGAVANLLSPGVRYYGYDPAPSAVALCHARRSGLTFATALPEEPYEATLSLDVIFHLTDDADYRAYLALLFGRGERYALMYGTSELRRGMAPHVRHRRWLDDLPPTFELLAHQPSRGLKDFWICARRPR